MYTSAKFCTWIKKTSWLKTTEYNSVWGIYNRLWISEVRDRHVQQMNSVSWGVHVQNISIVRERQESGSKKLFPSIKELTGFVPKKQAQF